VLTLLYKHKILYVLLLLMSLKFSKIKKITNWYTYQVINFHNAIFNRK